MPLAGKMTFDELFAGLTQYFASKASEWWVRQAINQRRQLEKESLAAVIIHIAFERIALR